MKKSKIPSKTILAVGWALTLIFLLLALYLKNERWANAFSDAFGTALSIVLLSTIAVIILKAKKIL